MSKDNKLTSPKRERVSINFLGVDNSSPDISVKDGAMAEMSNVRYNDDAWRPVHMFDKVGEIPEGYRVAYHHPAAGEKVYVITANSATFYSYDMESGTRTEIASINEVVKDIKHFGNVLIFIGQDNSVEYYVLQDGKYYRFEKPTAPKVELAEGDRTQAKVSWYGENPNDDRWDDPEEITTQHPFGFWALYDEGGNSTFPASKDNKWLGELAFFACYRLKDGSVISPSPIGITASESVVADVLYTDLLGQVKVFRKWNKLKVKTTEYWGILSYAIDVNSSATTVPLWSSSFTHPQMQYFSPTLNISIPTELTPLVESVAVYTTRINSPFKFIESEDMDSHFEDNKLPEQPFYLAKEIRVSEFSGGNYTLTLDYTLLKDVVSNARYVPSNNIHDLQFGSALDYNERLHIGDVTTILHTPSEEANLFAVTDNASLSARFLLSVNENSFRTDSISIRSDGTRSAGYQSIISYHDHRATAFHSSRVYDPDGSPFVNAYEYAYQELMSAPNNNVAYHIAQNTSSQMSNLSLHYYALELPYLVTIGGPTLPSTNTIVQENKIMVSQTNNPFAFDFANTYSFGSADNKVLAMQSAAVEMSDAKFGEFPLYVFTESGIFGLQSGAESVYSNVIPINYDRIINPRTLAINYNVVYITKKGIHLLNSEGSTLISQPIDTMLGYPDVDKFQRLYPLRSTQYNEIAFVVDGIAYVYSLINGVWSTRSFDMYPISQEEAYRNNEVFNIINENTALPNSCVIKSRPIKLGSVEYKRLETFIPRFANLAETENMSITITIEGSNDCKEWKELRKVEAQGYKVIRRTPQSCKYFRFFLEFIDVEEFTFSNVDLEYYVKFLRRMR